MSDPRPTSEVLRDISALFDELAEHFDQAQPRTPRTAALERQQTAPSVADVQRMVDGNAAGKPGAKRTTQLTEEVRARSMPAALAAARKAVLMFGANGPQLKAAVLGDLARDFVAYDTKLIDDAIRAAKVDAVSDDDQV